MERIEKLLFVQQQLLECISIMQRDSASNSLWDFPEEPYDIYSYMRDFRYVTDAILRESGVTSYSDILSETEEPDEKEGGLK